ncbi:MAG: aminomethyl-transferring glycine dehydrogenase [Verrucomicrobium sp.]|nr:aminomethyl-transferring glycine dehydrogenase [Verrucomicrobium sp.]
MSNALPDPLLPRHLGSGQEEVAAMLAAVGQPSLDALADAAVPAAIRLRRPLDLPAPVGEGEALEKLRAIAGKNRVFRSYLGTGYYDCVTPPVILRNILENPAWYTSYTPYQAEISQGRLEALLNFQTMVTDLTGMEIANASLLDEATAAAEAMALAHAVSPNTGAVKFLVAGGCFPQTIEVLRTRAEPLGIEIVVGIDGALHKQFDETFFGLIVQYPRTEGRIWNYSSLFSKAKEKGIVSIVAADLLALTVLMPPGQFGADVVVGSAQRFGVPMGYGGPHAAFFATREAYKRSMPGRLIGVSKDAQGNPALRLALQTREQHIRRDKATSNICTAQALLANMASSYAVYHGPAGLRRIATRIHHFAKMLAEGARRLGHSIGLKGDPEEMNWKFFDTVQIILNGETPQAVYARALERQINLHKSGSTVRIALDETTTEADVDELLEILTPAGLKAPKTSELKAEVDPSLPEGLAREGEILTHPVFRKYHTETEMLRYLRRLEMKDFSLATSMIPLGSCTMKLNATTEMIPVTWPEFGRLHPFAPRAQAAGYAELFSQLEKWLGEITGFPAVSLQPNAGSQGEYAGLIAVRDYYASRGEKGRDVCLIPVSAHGTNPASAAMAGFRVVAVQCEPGGDIDVADLKAKIAAHRDSLGVLMVTYPSTHGVFEDGIDEICRLVHEAGGQVYMDGANMNAQVGLCRPGDIGADVCHLNLHKTFCIPHGGGGPGVGPIGVAKHLAPFLPGHKVAGLSGAGAVSAAPWGSASILVISWAYIAMLGAEGLRQSTELALLNANYVARRLDPYFPVLYKGKGGLVAHECIVDLRPWKKRAGFEVEDVAKRLIDYGFHAPTMSWPVPGTLMIEPTESESKAELDRFCDAMISIHAEMEAAEASGNLESNPLKHAPHTAHVVTAEAWDRPYSREEAAFPSAAVREHKVWPPVGRVDNVYGDRNLVCTCPSVEELAVA